MNCHMDRLEVKLEENAWGASVVFKHTRVMSYAVLVRVERLGTRSNVGGRHDMEEILVRDECCSVTFDMSPSRQRNA